MATVVGIKPPINGQSFIPFKNSVLTLGPSSGIARAPRQALGPAQHVFASQETHIASTRRHRKQDMTPMRHTPHQGTDTEAHPAKNAMW